MRWSELGLERVLIVDWDVHHGNGTQAAFYDDPRVLFFSMHEAGHYPGTGMAREVGRGAGEGFTVNVPLQPGSGDGAVKLAFESLLEPLARAFRPQLVLVSAGYDPQEGDPLGDLEFSRDGVPVDGGLPSRALSGDGRVGSAVLPGGRLLPEDGGCIDCGHLAGDAGRIPSFERTASSESGPTCARRSKKLRPYWKGVL